VKSELKFRAKNVANGDRSYSIARRIPQEGGCPLVGRPFAFYSFTEYRIGIPARLGSQARHAASCVTVQPVHLYLGSQALELGGPSGLSADAGLTAGAGLLVEQVGAQVPLRAQVCASQPTREIADVGCGGLRRWASERERCRLEGSARC